MRTFACSLITLAAVCAPVLAEKFFGDFTLGSVESQTGTIVSSAKCSAKAQAESYEEASGLWVTACAQAIAHTCNGEVDLVSKSFEGTAEAYAKIALEAHSKCETTGDAFGCAIAKAEADAQAQATFDIWFGAHAQASNSECPCLTQAFSEAHAEVSAFGEVWASVWGAVEADVCAEDGEDASETDKLECYANAITSVWASAIARAWAASSCTEVPEDTPVCEPACKKSGTDCEQCREEVFAAAHSWAEVVIQTDLETDAQCTRTFTDVVGTVAVTAGEELDNGFAGAGGDGPSTSRASCDASSFTSSISTAVSAYARAVTFAVRQTCRRNDYLEIPRSMTAAASTFAEVYADIYAECDVEGNMASGCASASTFNVAFAEAAAEGIAAAWATTSFSRRCNCQQDVEATAFASADLQLELLSRIELATLADVCQFGTGFISEGLTIDCYASAFVALTSQALAKFLRDVDGPCEALIGNAEAEAFADVEAEFVIQPGFCTGEGFGGEVADFLADAGVIEV